MLGSHTGTADASIKKKANKQTNVKESLLGAMAVTFEKTSQMFNSPQLLCPLNDPKDSKGGKGTDQMNQQDRGVLGNNTLRQVRLILENPGN